MEINFRPRAGVKVARPVEPAVTASLELVHAEGMSKKSLVSQFIFALFFLVFAGGMFWV